MTTPRWAACGPTVLNPSLLDLVSRAFTGVRVTRRGEPMEGYYAPDPKRPDRLRLTVVRHGEMYLADCPFCGDARGRLAVSHRWGVYDPTTGSSGYGLWKCYNQECQQDYRNRERMQTRYLAFPLGAPARRVEGVRRVEAGALAPCEFPGLLAPLSELPADHPARAYLADRGFDPDALCRTWGVAYAVSVPARRRESMVQGRLVVPVYRDRVMVGWQARYVGEADWKALGLPKYLTYFPKSLVLYGADEAAAALGPAEPVVVVEGVTDVWRYGPGAVCPFGKQLSPTQARLLANLAAGRPVVWVPDADDQQALSSAARSARLLSAEGHAGRIGVAPLPEGLDPAGLTTPQLRRRVAAAGWVDALAAR